MAITTAMRLFRPRCASRVVKDGYTKLRGAKTNSICELDVHSDDGPSRDPYRLCLVHRYMSYMPLSLSCVSIPRARVPGVVGASDVLRLLAV
eukprot:scaffold97869_cov28-Tisochrysis_lutea.AAC.1